MSTAKRPTAPRQAKPAQRYFRGKAPKGATAVSDSDESDEDAGDAPQFEEGDVPLGGEQQLDEDGEDDDNEDPHSSRPAVRQTVEAPTKGMNVSLRNVNITDGKVFVDGRVESGRTEMEDESSSEEEDEAAPSKPPGIAGEDEGSSSEYETDSEEETKAVPLFRPVFIPKRARVTVQEREAESQNTEEAQAKREEEAEKRKKESHDLVAESIKRELGEQEAQEAQPDLDDTDGVDPAAEFEEWRLRELGRIKRDKEVQLQREQEREEIERRRALPEEQRLAEDLEHAKKSRDEKPKGSQKFLQKYFHKGAFHQDEDILKKRDYTEATESTVDISMLPKVMQVKNFGKRSQTKYTHLLDQDTSRETKPAAAAGLKEGQSCFNCGGPHFARDCPNRDDTGRGPGSGSNGGHVTVQPGRQWGVRKDMPPPSGPASNGERRDGERRQWKDRDTEDGYRRRRDDDDRNRDRPRDRERWPDFRDDSKPARRDRSRSPRRIRSRSRSPRDRDEPRHVSSHRRPRSRSPSLDRYDKRRRRD